MLRVRHFLGTSENAVRTQVIAALIAYLLLRAAQATQDAATGPLLFARLVRANIVHSQPLDVLLKPRLRPASAPGQGMLL